jgi:hypothetical protein
MLSFSRDLTTMYCIYISIRIRKGIVICIIINSTIDWKKALDDNKFIAAILIDLSKAFDCLPHTLLILKLESYGLSENSLKLLNSYLENRRQGIKIGNNYSEWDTLIKGVPQGSILGPVL